MPKVSSHALDPIIMVLGKHEFDLRTLASPHVINVWVFPWDREGATRGQRRLGLSPNLSFFPPVSSHPLSLHCAENCVSCPAVSICMSPHDALGLARVSQPNADCRFLFRG